MWGFAAVERLDEWLNNRNSAIEGARVAPAFQIMRFGNMPMANARRLILVEAEADAHSEFLEAGRKINVGRYIEYRVASNYHEHVDGARFHFADKLAQRFELVDRHRFDRTCISNCLVHIPEKLIHLVNKRVNSRRLLFARDHDAAALVFF